ncbi:hypothetical protein EDB80DRAFT_419302 [Ilyonectria destructans]|nr:hypothetical protein EDB80DRAFT_419302 [Ilyonectria destructans]
MASPMDRLPPEVLSIIFSHVTKDTSGIKSTTERVPKNSLGRYAPVSRQWQQYIERQTFRDLYVTLDRMTSAVAGNILTPQRLSYLRYIKLEFSFPPRDRRVKRVKHMELELESDHIFGNTIESLFRLLEPTPLRPHPFVIVEFAIAIQKINPRISGAIYNSPIELEHARVARAEHWTQYPELLSHYYDKLPMLPMVVSFRTRLVSHVVTIEPGSACLIAHKMPRLEEVDWELHDGDKTEMPTRVWLRDGFAKNLSKLPKSLKRFSVEYFRLPPKDHAYQPRSIIPTGGDGDTLSNALFHFTQQNALTDFHFKGSVETTILWPTDSTEVPRWPNMKNYTLSLHFVMPSGKWLGIKGTEVIPPRIIRDLRDAVPPDIPGEQKRNEFRTIPHPGIVDGIFLAAGKGVGQMPSVERFKLDFSGSPLNTCLEFDTIHSAEIPCLEFSGVAKAQPSKETIQAWRETAGKLGRKFGFKLND